MNEPKDDVHQPSAQVETQQQMSSENDAAATPAKTPIEKEQASPATAQPLLDRTLQFLATANNETLGACLVGLGATTYLVLGRVGLVLIGVVGGVVLHATWEKNSFYSGTGDGAQATEETRRRETGLDVVQRVLKWRSNVADGQNSPSSDSSELEIKLLSGKKLDFSDFQPETASALNELTDAVIRDYVKWWYSPILPSENLFPAACRQTLVAFIHGVSSHLSRKRPADAFLDFLTNSSSIMIVFLNELSSAIGASPNTPAADAIESYLKLKPESNLASVLDTKHQSRKLEMVAEDVLQNYLEHKTLNCRPAHIFLREIFAKVVLEMTIQACSKPEWINGWIVYLLEEGEPELMNAIDAGVEQTSGKALEAARNQSSPSEGASKTSAEIKSEVESAKHKRAVSRAQEAMDEAMKEAQRLTQMIAEEDARRAKESGKQAQKENDQQQKDHGQTQQELQSQEPKPQPQLQPTTSSTLSDTSEGTTHGVVTPTSSQDDLIELAASKSGVDSPQGEATPATATQPLPTTPKSQQQQFTNFDQLGLPPAPPESPGKKEVAPLTLYNATVSLLDDSMPGDRGTIKNKPAADYFIQIEPASSHHPGWMITRKYADFETLHEVLRRIANISGVNGFSEGHAQLPPWKGHTKSSLRGELERYMNDAIRFKPLAESEGMKRFLEKDTNLGRSSGGGGKGFPGLGWPTPSAFENMGKGMMDALTKAPNQVAGGGKALFGNVTGVLGGKRNSVTSTPTLQRTSTAGSISGSPASSHGRTQSTVAPLPGDDPGRSRSESTVSPLPNLRKSQDSLRTMSVVDTQPAPIPQMERRPSLNPEELKSRTSMSSRRSSNHLSSREHSRAPSVRSVRSIQESVDLSPLMGGDQILNLPPPPTDVPDDYEGPSSSPVRHTQQPSLSQAKFQPGHARSDTVRTDTDTHSLVSPKTAHAPRPPKPPITEQETQVAVELLFAIITELYTLSSAWQIRKTLLQAAKTFLLRPGNPQLESIRLMLQETVLDANTSDSGIAAHLKKLRLNSLPTEEELKLWPAEMSAEEKEKLQKKARKLLVERGMPVALTGVMGQQATGEALGRVFDCLQVEKVARGLIFGVLLQGVRTVTQ